jgi:DNA-binding transcriptional ArsR family regulator
VRGGRNGARVRGANGAAAVSPARTRGEAALSREALELLAKRFRALADATRLALLQALFEEEHTVQELCALTGASPANASKHLALLLDQGLVARRRNGLYTHYRIADPTLERLCDLVCGSLAERHEALRARLPVR